MSGSKITGNGGGDVVRNSALSFVACAQPASPGGGGGGQEDGSSQDDREGTQPERSVPAGLKALCEAYSRLYPDQPNPLQVTTRLKYWLGGHDPLDYISMYWNPGKPDEHIPPHWHYVSFGLSDLHGDGRVHAPPDRVLLRAGTAGGCAGDPAPALPPSGFGLELTFRLEAPAPPPLWPAALLQALARYLFTTGNKFVPGDHISWHCALDGGGGAAGGGGGGAAGGGGGEGVSRVRHLLVAEDPQLRAVSTPHGAVSFIQLVGCTGRELRAAQRGSGFDVLRLMAEDPNCGGSWLVTRMRRRSSARRVRAAGGAGAAGGAAPATLAGVSARMRWEPWTPSPEEEPSPQLSLRVQRQIKETLQRGLSTMSTDRTGPEGHTGMSTDSFEMSSIERALPQIPELMQGSWRSDAGGAGAGAGAGAGEGEEALRGVHVWLTAEGAALLPLALRGRVLHGAHFTWRAAASPSLLPAALTLLAPGVTGARASLHQPYVARGLWLQMVIPPELAEEMLKKVSPLAKLAETDSETDSESERDEQTPTTLPLTFTWPKHRLKISVVPDHELL